MTDLLLTKRLDAASPMLAVACCRGSHFKSATLEVCRQVNGKKIVVLRYVIGDSVLGKVRSTGDGVGGNIPKEEITLRCSRIQWEYTPVDKEDRAGAPVKKGWDLRENKEFSVG